MTSWKRVSKHSVLGHIWKKQFGLWSISYTDYITEEKVGMFFVCLFNQINQISKLELILKQHSTTSLAEPL